MTSIFRQHPRILVLSSNLCTDVFGDNRNYVFSNYFDEPIISSPGRNLSIKLRSIACSLDVFIPTERISFGGEAGEHLVVFRPTEKFPGVMKIILQELQPQLYGQQYTHALGSLTFPPSDNSIINDYYAFHQFSNANFLPLKNTSISAMRILLVDADDNEIVLGGPAPTTIELELSEEMENSTAFTITCSSNQPTLYPENTLSQFTIPLPEPIHASNYEVALTSVVYPPEMRDDVNISLEVEQVGEINVEVGRMQNTGVIIQAIQRSMREKGLEDFVRFKLTRQGRERMAYLVSVVNRPIFVKVNKNFLHFVGNTLNMKSRFSFFNEGDRMIFDEGMMSLNNLRSTPTALLECDIVKMSHMGRGWSPLLQCIAVKTSVVERGRSALMRRWTKLKDLVYEPNNLIFTDVKTTPFNSISFTFRDPEGHIKRLRAESVAGEEKRIIITLLFRPKKVNALQKLMM